MHILLRSHLSFRRAVGAILLALLLSPRCGFAQDEAASSDASASIRLLIEEAIRLGVPLYNGGQPAACAAVYRTALRALELLVPSEIDRDIAARALAAAAGSEPSEGAWILRYALDDLYATAQTESASAMNEFSLDFSAENESRWSAVNDNVMGGVSRGGWTLSGQGTGVFSGRLSLRNNGGFSSVRMRVEGASLDDCAGIEMRVRGDGRTYALLAGSDGASGSWQRAFVASEEWQIVRIPFAEMALSIRGWRPARYPPIAGRRVQTLGFIISDKDERPFRMEIDWMRGYRVAE